GQGQGGGKGPAARLDQSLAGGQDLALGRQGEHPFGQAVPGGAGGAVVVQVGVQPAGQAAGRRVAPQLHDRPGGQGTVDIGVQLHRALLSLVLSYFRGNPFLRAVARQKFLPPNPLVLNRFSRRVSACENRSAAPAASRCFVHWTRFAAAAPGDTIFQRTAHSPAALTLSLYNLPVGVRVVRY